MFDFLIAVFDIPLICILIILILSSMIFISSIHNIFLNLFISILLVIFIASTVIIQQSNLAEFVIISIFFLLAIMFFIFNLHNDFSDESFVGPEKVNFKLISVILVFLISFILIGVNFYNISKTQNEYVFRNTQIVNNANIKNYRGNIEKNDLEYVENISLLNQNKIFQKLTHIIILYVCIVTILYFFNKGEENER